MPVETIFSVCIAVVFAYLLGRSLVVSNRRDKRITTLKTNVAKLSNSLDYIAHSSKYDRSYEIEENPCACAYNVFMKVYVHAPLQSGEYIDNVCYCLIKQFPFAGDMDFARRQAEELLDKLNEK